MFDYHKNAIRHLEISLLPNCFDGRSHFVLKSSEIFRNHVRRTLLIECLFNKFTQHPVSTTNEISLNCHVTLFLIYPGGIIWCRPLKIGILRLLKPWIFWQKITKYHWYQLFTQLYKTNKYVKLYNYLFFRLETKKIHLLLARIFFHKHQLNPGMGSWRSKKI